MISMKDIKDNPWIARIESLCNEYGVDLKANAEVQKFFLDFGGNDTPSASKHHGNFEWGHWEHIHSVIQLALQLNKLHNLQYAPLSIIKVVLAHDIRKFEFPCTPCFNKNGQRSAIPWEWTDQAVYLPEGLLGVLDGSKYFPLDSIEQQAIFYHNMHYDYDINPHDDKIGKFTWFIHTCDLYSSKLLEQIKVWKKE